MADFAVLAIGIDPRQSESGGRRVEKQLDQIIDKNRKVGTESKNSFGTLATSAAAGQMAVQAFNAALSKGIEILGSIVQVGRDFESTMKRVQAVSQASASDFQRLQNAAREMGATTKFSATEAAEGLEFLSMAGFSAAEAAQALPGVLQLAAASGADLGRAADIASNALTAMGLKIADLGRVNDVLLSTTTGANVTINHMAESLKYAAPLAAATSVSIEQLSGLIGVLGNAGIQGSQAGTSLAGAMSRLLNPTAEVSKIFDELNVKTGKGLIDTIRELEQAGATSGQVLKIFGEEAGRSILAIQTGGGIAAVDKLIERLEKAGGTAEKTAKVMGETLDGAIKNLQSSLESVGIDIFNQSSSEATQIINLMTQAVRDNQAGFVAIGLAIENAAKFVLDFMQRNQALETVLKGVESGVDGATIVIATLGTIAETTALRMEYMAAAGSAMILALKGDIDALSFALEDMDRISKKSTESVTTGLSHVLDAFDGIIGQRQKLLQLGEGSAKVAVKEADALKAVASSANDTKKEITALNDAISATPEPVNQVANAIESLINTQAQQVNTSSAVENQIYREVSALDSLAGKYGAVSESIEKARDRQVKFVDSALVGTTFTMDVPNDIARQWFGNLIPSGSSPTQSQPAYSMPSFSQYTPTPSVGTEAAANRQIQSLYQGFLGLGSQIEDYLLSQESVNAQLEAYQDRLIEKNRELLSLNENDLEERLSISQDIFGIQKQIDSLTEKNRQKEAQAARTVESILSNTVSFYDQIALADIGGLLPIDRFAAIENRFLSMSEALASIDWTEITEADQSIIANFRSTAEQYLDAAQDVYKSGDPYQVVKDTILMQTADLAGKLTGEFNSVDLSLIKSATADLSNTAKTASGSVAGLSSVTGSMSGIAQTAATRVDGVRIAINNTGTSATTATTATNTLASSIGVGNSSVAAAAVTTTDRMNVLRDGLSGGLKNAMDNVSGASGQASSALSSTAGGMSSIGQSAQNAAGQSNLLTDTLSDPTGFKNASNYMSQLQNNINNTVGYMAQRFGELVNQWQSGAAGSAPPGTTAPTPVANPSGYYVTGSSSSNIYVGYKDAQGNWAGGSDKAFSVNLNLGGQYQISQDRQRFWIKASGGSAYLYSANTGYNTNPVSHFENPFALGIVPAATGKWSINKATQPALLHQGEMVIREDDAPIVRSMMRTAGISDSYGVPSTSGGMQGSGKLETLMEAILNLLENPIAPMVTINAQRLNQELDRQRRLQA